MAQKIGIMGGTFNPIHNGHIMIAKEAYEQYALNKVLFIPNGNAYLKTDVLNKYARYEMVKLAISDYPFFELSDIETNKEGKSYSCETILELKQLYPSCELYFIIGADSLLNMEKWKKPEIIFANTTILLAKRPGSNDADIAEKISYLKKIFFATVSTINIKEYDISSTQIRDKIKSGIPVYDVLNEKVYDYILKKGFYK